MQPFSPTFLDFCNLLCTDGDDNDNDNDNDDDDAIASARDGGRSTWTQATPRTASLRRFGYHRNR